MQISFMTSSFCFRTLTGIEIQTTVNHDFQIIALNLQWGLTRDSSSLKWSNN